MREMAFPGFKFQKFPPDPPSDARSLKMLRSDFWLDPPLTILDEKYSWWDPGSFFVLTTLPQTAKF